MPLIALPPIALPRIAAASAAALLLCGTLPAAAQVPGQVTGGAAAGGAGAGGVPTLQQLPSGEIAQPSGNDPARAPGSKADAGTALPKADANSGTTTSYASAEPSTPVEWPCAQRRVPTISAGTIWSGPDLAQGKGWDQDNDVAGLAQKLASRRLPLDEADTLITDFAKATTGADKGKKLTELFVGTLDVINASRTDILQGIMRYAAGQQRLAERMRAESDKISAALSDVQGPTGIAATEANRDFAWDQRIFKERRQALTYVCETPSLLERRAYEIGKRIQAQL